MDEYFKMIVKNQGFDVQLYAQMTVNYFELALNRCPYFFFNYFFFYHLFNLLNSVKAYPF